ncbi:prolipoprotein diacylglyceryl transferase [Arachnia propionica]|uniref:Phosphatidylglycerol--prolipoprotein diacylglyceryl transferase n=1 Tax=Arachnia propionica TaxID=1750 RepID=A0A3P1T4Y3_9ACTN|nr:prolipoprotein diacylglyceryl transferase [Arachnia propionica]RRD04384.1 prolipoprotein diacylglyceryl transferase [Arachnia propionica]
MWKAGGVHLLEIPFPKIDPVAFAIGPLKVHWYGLMYLLAFVIAYLLMRRRLRHEPYRSITAPRPWEKSDIEDLLMYAIAGVIIGGRLGYVLFYEPANFLANPGAIIRVWDGGMSFHGGAIGVVLGIWFFSWRRGRPFLQVADFLVPTAPLGLAAGRIGNFINGELWGREASEALPWAMRFPTGGVVLRHPSQLYQALLEGVLLFILLWWYARRPRLRGQVAAAFLVGYGTFRFIAEFWRQPDSQLGLLSLGLSMGQWLSLPMIVAGVALWLWSRSRGVTDVVVPADDEESPTDDEKDPAEDEKGPAEDEKGPVDDEKASEEGETPDEDEDAAEENGEEATDEKATTVADGEEPVEEPVEDVDNPGKDAVTPPERGSGD